jgi:hypothetical protein
MPSEGHPRAKETTMESSLISRLRAPSTHKLSTARPATEEELGQVEQEYGVAFPADYRQLVLFSRGLGVRSRGTPIHLSFDDTSAHLEDESLAARLPAMVVIGDDGGGSVYFYDPRDALGKGAFAVFLVPMSALGFEDAIFAGRSLTEVIEHVLADEDFYRRPRLGPAAAKR